MGLMDAMLTQVDAATERLETVGASWCFCRTLKACIKKELTILIATRISNYPYLHK